MQRRRMVAGNWKMHGRITSGVQLARELLEKIKQQRPEGCDIVIAPPFSLLWPISELAVGTALQLAGQDCHHKTHGPYTGDTSAAMLLDVGCRLTIVGHSERRTAHGESNSLVAEKAAAALQAGLTAIVCVGESEQARDQGQHLAVVTEQLHHSLPPHASPANVIVAYEPVWAIGTGRSASAEEIAEMHTHIRAHFGERGETMRILYGGSVNPGSAPALAAVDGVDGFLVGGASLNADGFWQIVETCLHRG